MRVGQGLRLENVVTRKTKDIIGLNKRVAHLSLFYEQKVIALNNKFSKKALGEKNPGSLKRLQFDVLAVDVIS